MGRSRGRIARGQADLFGRKHQSYVIDRRERHGEAAEAAPALPPLRVALDVRFWGMSGLGTYVRELLGAFARLELPVRWTLIGPEEVRPELPENLEIEKWIGYYAPVYSAGSLLRYPRLREVDLFHYPHYN